MYRDGVGDNQLDIVSDYEVRQMSEAFQLFGEDYDPKLSVVVVGKRINTRIFEVQVIIGLTLPMLRLLLTIG